MPKTKNFSISLEDFWGGYSEIIFGYGSVPVAKSNIGIGGSTYRAFGHYVKKDENKKPLHQPNVVFRKWNERFSKKEIPLTADSFSNFHERACASLSKYWEKETGVPLPPYPYAAKLVDLRIKHIVWRMPPESRETQGKLSYLVFQPLDAYSLRFMADNGIPRPDDRKYPKTIRMGIIKTDTEYAYFQKQIRNICDKANVPLFAFDHYVWNTQS